ncbi:MAG TPA: hypothetical protein VOA41_15505 [Candidatus Dormibacteraeota bacterium]|nr:hypothetical protein [Candidatus Dormibacteraeota bacterium]
MEKPGKKRPWKSLRDSHFPTATAATTLSLDDRDHFLQDPPASVASLRRLITSIRNADHDQPGIPITFAGIPKVQQLFTKKIIQRALDAELLLDPAGRPTLLYPDLVELHADNYIAGVRRRKAPQARQPALARCTSLDAYGKVAERVEAKRLRPSEAAVCTY